jgi:DNA repair photolyase
MVAPVIPGLTDHEMPAILRAAADAGAVSAGTTMLRLPYAVKEVFEAWLSEHVPDRRKKVLSRVRSVRGGRLNDPRFGSRMEGEGPFAEQVRDLFQIARTKAGIPEHGPRLSTASFRRPGPRQMPLFEG